MQAGHQGVLPHQPYDPFMADTDYTAVAFAQAQLDYNHTSRQAVNQQQYVRAGPAPVVFSLAAHCPPQSVPPVIPPPPPPFHAAPEPSSAQVTPATRKHQKLINPNVTVVSLDKTLKFSEPSRPRGSGVFSPTASPLSQYRNKQQPVRVKIYFFSFFQSWPLVCVDDLVSESEVSSAPDSPVSAYVPKRVWAYSSYHPGMSETESRPMSVEQVPSAWHQGRSWANVVDAKKRLPVSSPSVPPPPPPVCPPPPPRAEVTPPPPPLAPSVADAEVETVEEIQQEETPSPEETPAPEVTEHVASEDLPLAVPEPEALEPVQAETIADVVSDHEEAVREDQTTHAQEVGLHSHSPSLCF
jgi:hypothetical protein